MPVALGQVTIQTVSVIGSIADQSRREGAEEAVSEDAFGEPDFRVEKRFAGE